MKLSTKESLAWLEAHGNQMSESNYYKIKAKINATTEKRKFDLVRKGLFEQHIERIDQLETILKLSWENYHRETNAFRKQKILESIANLQPLLSKYYESSQMIIEHDAKRMVNTGHLSEPNGTNQQFDFFNF
jgi:hypothetical protein